MLCQVLLISMTQEKKIHSIGAYPFFLTFWRVTKHWSTISTCHHVHVQVPNATWLLLGATRPCFRKCVCFTHSTCSIMCKSYTHWSTFSYLHNFAVFVQPCRCSWVQLDIVLGANHGLDLLSEDTILVEVGHGLNPLQTCLHSNRCDWPIEAILSILNTFLWRIIQAK